MHRRFAAGTAALAVAVTSLTSLVGHPAVGAAPSPDDQDHRFGITVLSGRPDQVSGGDALVRVTLPDRVGTDRVRVTLGSTDVTGAFGEQDDGSLVGLVDSLVDGANTLTVSASGRGGTRPRTERL